jgi:hypothetical protein
MPHFVLKDVRFAWRTTKPKMNFVSSRVSRYRILITEIVPKILVSVVFALIHSLGVDQWLQVNKTCPFCKQPIDAERSKEATEDQVTVELESTDASADTRSNPAVPLSSAASNQV